MKKGYTLAELAKITESKLVGDPSFTIFGAADLSTATKDEASFLANSRYEEAAKESMAGVIFITYDTTKIEGKNYLLSSNPSKAFQILLDLLYKERLFYTGFKGVHLTSVIHPSVILPKDVSIGPHAVIDEGVTIGNSVFIGSGSYIGPYTSIGESCFIHPHVTIREGCQIGNRVILQPGCVIGSCGFGYLTTREGIHEKLNQIGNVIIEDDVEIGANTTIDRARLQSTRIGKGSKLDNLIQIGHGVKLGKNNIIVAQTGIAGSTSLADEVVIGGQVAIAGHLHLEKGVKIAGKSGVSKSLKKGEYGGFPATPLREYQRREVLLRRIEEFTKRITRLESIIQ